MAKLEIRSATLDDAPLLARLNYEVQMMHFEAMPERYKKTEIDDPAVIKDFETRVLSETMLTIIAEMDGTGVGYACIAVIETGPNPFIYGHRRLHIDQMAVTATHRGQGIGTALLDYVFEEAKQRDITEITLGVVAFNKGAQNLYKRHGFIIENMRMVRRFTR